MIRAIVFHPKVIQKISSNEELEQLKEVIKEYDISVFFIAEGEWKYKHAIQLMEDILKDFVSKTKVKANRGSPKYIHWITENYGIYPYEILYVGQDPNDLDWWTSINGGTFYIHAAFVTKPKDKFFARTPKNLIEIIKLFREMGNGLFGYQFQLNDSINRKFLFDIEVRIPVDGGNRVHLAEIIKSDYEQSHTIAGRPAKDSLLLLLLLQLWLSGTLNSVNYFAFYPGHKAQSGNWLLESYLSKIAKIAFRSYFKDNLIFRARDTLQKHKARQQGRHNSVRSENEFNTLCIKEDIPLNRKIIIIDDFSTTGLSLESAKILLLSAGYKPTDINLVAIGKYGYHYTTYNLRTNVSINPYDCEDKIREGDYYRQTYKIARNRNYNNERKLLKIIESWIRVSK